MSKRILALAAILAVLMTMVVLPTTASAIYITYSKCGNGKPLNVREGPGKEYAVIGHIAYGDEVHVDHNLGNGWAEIVWGSVPGYVMLSLTSATKPGPYVPTPTPDPSQKTSGATSYNTLFSQARIVTPYTITLKTTRASGSANVRWAPSKSATLLRAYAAGQQMKVIAELGTEWFQVEDPMTGVVGFVNKAYVN